jgi:uncharacterized protein (DUF885 family)
MKTRCCVLFSSVLALGLVPLPAALADAPAATPAPARSAALLALLDEHYQQVLREDPITASMRGDTRYNDRLPDISPAAFAAQRSAYRDRLARLNAIDARTLSEQDRIDLGLLRLVLENELGEERFLPEQRAVDNLSGVQVNLPQLADRLRFSTEKDYADFATRLEAVPKLVEQTIEQLKLGLASGRVPPKVSVSATAAQASAIASDAVKADPSASPFYRPFLGRAKDDPTAARARKAISEGIVPAYARLAAFLKDEYVPKCRDSFGASDSVDGRALYDFMLKVRTTTDLTAEQVHEIGLKEVARIRGEMFDVIARSDWPDKDKHPARSDAQFAAFVEYLRTNPRFYHTTPEALLAEYREIAKRIDPEMSKLFGHLPRTPYGVREIPLFAARASTTAYYYSGSYRAGTPGYFMANTYALDQRPRYEMISLTLHEAVPGHHHERSITDELEGLHPFRSMLSFTVFVEGWGLYAERLGLEMGDAPIRREADGTGGGTGLFTNPYDDFGRLTYEQWRACRLVVDTGLHALGWSRQQAIDFMLKNTALSPLNIEREVDRYIAWPGQATAYKIGELKIRELRAKAERTLGDRFDIRAFHDTILTAGPLPLGVLEERVNRWIESVAAAR